MRMQLGIIGGGFVGQAAQLFGYRAELRCLTYDVDPTKCSNNVKTLADLAECDVIFICVPTPMNMQTGECHTNIVSSCIEQARKACPFSEIIVRSTVPIGFCAQHKVHFMPEFLTERNWYKDTFACQEWFLGVDDNSTNVVEKVHRMFQESALYQTELGVRPVITIVSTKVAESIKYFRNCFLATKVAFCNEFYRMCDAKDVDYSIVENYAARDLRIGHSHTAVPGPDGKFGFGGTCFPKDMASLQYQMKQVNVQSPLIEAAILRNNTIDRCEADWKEDKGRAVI